MCTAGELKAYVSHGQLRIPVNIRELPCEIPDAIPFSRDQTYSAYDREYAGSARHTRRTCSGNLASIIEPDGVGGLSDNEHDVFYLAIPKMTEFFNRSDRRIRSAIRRLERPTVLKSDPHPGCPSHFSLRLAPPIAMDPTASIMW